MKNYQCEFMTAAGTVGKRLSFFAADDVEAMAQVKMLGRFQPPSSLFGLRVWRKGELLFASGTGQAQE